jgi:hypothetical protein
MMRVLFRAGVLALAGVGAKSLYDKYLADSSPESPLWPERPIDLSDLAHAPLDSEPTRATRS